MTPKCTYCKRPGEYRGWVFKSRERVARAKRRKGETLKSAVDRQMKACFKKVYEPMCEHHLLENQFQLMPYECTAACIKRRLASNTYKMKREEMIVYFPLGPILGGDRPKCGWCRKNLRPARVK